MVVICNVCLSLSINVFYNRCPTTFVLTKSELIQIDATIITGVLILLTITSLTHADPLIKNPIGIWDNPKIWAAIIIIPFAISALCEFGILTEKKYHGENAQESPKTASRNGLKFALGGFVYLMLAVLVISAISI